MQETTVGWDPMYESRLPWFTKVFVVYLAVVLFASAFRAIRLMWSLRGLREMERGNPSAPSRFQLLWEICYARTASLKNLSVLTVLLTLLIFAWSTSRILLGVTMEKVTGVTFLAGAMAEVLTTFSTGILVSVVLYAFAILYETALVRRKARFDRANITNQLPLPEQRGRNTI
jgi:hypothetical protein